MKPDAILLGGTVRVLMRLANGDPGTRPASELSDERWVSSVIMVTGHQQNDRRLGAPVYSVTFVRAFQVRSAVARPVWGTRRERTRRSCVPTYSTSNR